MFRPRDGRIPGEVSELKGGRGTIHFEGLISEEESHGRLKFFRLMTLDPGCSIGLHPHVDNAEIYWCMEGELCYIEDGVEHKMLPGDISYTDNGSVHAMENRSSAPARFAAIILQ